MRNCLLAIIAKLCAMSAIAQPFGGTYTLPSRTYQPGAADDVVSFATPILLDPMSPSYPNFGNITYSFFIDTNFVDMEFSKVGGTYHVSDSINSTATTYSLTFNGFIKGSPETGGQGTVPGTIMRQGPIGSTVFEVTSGVALGSAMNFTSPMANLDVCGDGTLLRFVVHPSAIYGLPGHSYQIAPNTTKSIVRCGTSASGTGNGPLVMVGGSFTVVPEPTTLIPIGGVLALIWNVRIRRRTE